MKRGYTLYIEENLREMLENISTEKRRSPSSIVNELLEKYFKKESDKKNG